MARTLVRVRFTNVREFVKEFDLPEEQAEERAWDEATRLGCSDSHQLIVGWEEVDCLDPTDIEVAEVEPLEVDEDDEEQEQ